MSDLQCAARFVVVAAGVPAPERLRGEQPAAVHAAPGTHGDAARLAAALAVPLRPIAAASNRTALAAALDELADEYRGECVAVVVPALAGLDGGVRPSADGGLLVEVDADGQRWAPWPVSAARGR